MPTSIHRLLLPLIFPHGLCPGDGKAANLIVVATDGLGRPVLRGTALAGALRHAWADLCRESSPETWFGDALNENRELPSRLRVPDTLILAGTDADDPGTLRTHNAINRHTGSVLSGSLFSLQSLPPFSRANVCLWLYHDSDISSASAKNFLADLVAIFSHGLTIGGNTARGIGLAKLDGQPLYQHFDCSNLDQHAAALDELHAWRNGTLPSSGSPLAASLLDTAPTLSVQLLLGIPSSQDLLIASGQGLDYEMEPQRVRAADGSLRWRIPGSSLRGLFRAWMTRLAAREKLPVADSATRWKDELQLSGDELGWGFNSQKDRERIQEDLLNNPKALNDHVTCPIMRLFGSCFAKGRIHFSDALSEPLPNDDASPRPNEQARMHVAVDRITGGANEGFLFDNTVITSGPSFSCTITIRHPQEREVRWLAATLRALHLGIIRAGSSKACGRLALLAQPAASGPFSSILASIPLNQD